jgi:hypothetical protein
MGAAGVDGCDNAVDQVVSFASPGEMKVKFLKCASGTGTLYISYSDAGMGGWDITQPIDLKKVAGKTVSYPVPAGREWALFYIEGSGGEQLAWFYHVEPLNPPVVTPDQAFSAIQVEESYILLRANNVPGAVYDLVVAAQYVGTNDTTERFEDLDMATLSHDRVFRDVLYRVPVGWYLYGTKGYQVDWYDQQGNRVGGLYVPVPVPWWELPFKLFASSVMNGGGGVTAAEVDGGK